LRYGARMRIAWIAIFLVVLLWSGINPKDTVTWALEVAPALLGAILGLFLLARLHDRQLRQSGP
jgi:putative membrane protein